MCNIIHFTILHILGPIVKIPKPENDFAAASCRLRPTEIPCPFTLSFVPILYPFHISLSISNSFPPVILRRGDYCHSRRERHFKKEKIMDLLSKNEFELLAKMNNAPAVSIFIPLEREADKHDENRIRLKNQLADAQERLQAKYDWGAREAEQILEPAARLISGSPEQLSARELRDRAWEKVAPQFKRIHLEAAQRFAAQASAGLAVDDLDQVVAAAHFGLVDVLFIAENSAQVWGKFDAQQVAIVPQSSSQTLAEELLDRSAVHTILNGGTVLILPTAEMPSAKSAAALLRAPVNIPA
jgi:hypothetical protein